MKVVLAPLNPTMGDFVENVAPICEAPERSESLGAEI